MEQIWINLMRIRYTGSIIPKMLFIEKVLIDVVKKREFLLSTDIRSKSFGSVFYHK